MLYDIKYDFLQPSGFRAEKFDNANTFELMLMSHPCPELFTEVSAYVKKTQSNKFYDMITELEENKGRIFEVFLHLRHKSRDEYLKILEDLANDVL